MFKLTETVDPTAGITKEPDVVANGQSIFEVPIAVPPDPERKHLFWVRVAVLVPPLLTGKGVARDIELKAGLVKIATEGLVAVPATLILLPAVIAVTCPVAEPLRTYAPLAIVLPTVPAITWLLVTVRVAVLPPAVTVPAKALVVPSVITKVEYRGIVETETGTLTVDPTAGIIIEPVVVVVAVVLHAPLMVINSPAVVACTQLPEVNAESVTFANVGAAVTATEGVVPVPTNIEDPAVNPVKHVEQDTAGVAPPEDTIGEVPVTAVTVPEPVPQAEPVTDNSPPVEACTHCPEVRALSVTLANVGAFVILITGVVPPVEAILPVPLTEVTPAKGVGVATATW